MMGCGAEKGVIPSCSELFGGVDEKVRDLLNPKNTGNLRGREHPISPMASTFLSKIFPYVANIPAFKSFPPSIAYSPASPACNPSSPCSPSSPAQNKNAVGRSHAYQSSPSWD
ncbi:hypothetical protein K443DRAFT_682736 [Laccaria amethystina LaAM-08-1]|uniref:Uncharacterized protein n=1 Tax=Laccaria amethystina LaAM-08-1 TaxID=1095629 RepID=A0A0C9X3H5_9AGAR|nr:hypothetical protein K443DRAFT_682736 [Laccaria amethystina LaAM-08-1]